jgi:uncharacterized protein (TIGR00255 family)
MTGVGRAETNLVERKVKMVVEIRSANHKFLELNMKLPTPLLGYEGEVRELIGKKIFRGSLQLSLNIQSSSDDKNSMSNNSSYTRALTLDYDLLANLLDVGKELKENYKLEGELDIKTIFTFPGVVVPAKPFAQDRNQQIWQQTKKTIIKALLALNKMKTEEGAHLHKDFLRRIKTISHLLKNIEKRSKKIRRELQIKVTPNLEQGAQLELLNASKATTEELVRLSSHTRAFLRAIKGKKLRSVGRKLEFILSEMLRETETILAKGRDTLISRDGITIKEEVDALREQVRNVE